MKEPAIGVHQTIIPNGQLSEVIQPTNRALDDPAASVPAQSASILVVGSLVVAPGLNNRLNPTPDEQGSSGIAAIGPVSNQAVWLLPGASWLMRPRDRDRVERRGEEADLCRGRRLQVCSQRSTRTIDQYHPLCALAACGQSDFGAPFFAGAKLPSTKHSFRWSCCRSLSWARNARHSVSRLPWLPTRADDASRCLTSHIA